MSTKTLSTLTAGDLQNAQVREGLSVCPAGKHQAKILKFVEEENYNYIQVEIEKKQFNFFYDYELRDSDALDRNVLGWLISLSTIPVTDSTPLLAITNSAIGHTYEIETGTYTSKQGKNAGKENHFIKFEVKPVLCNITVEDEEMEALPF